MKMAVKTEKHFTDMKAAEEYLLAYISKRAATDEELLVQEYEDKTTITGQKFKLTLLGSKINPCIFNWK